MVATLVLELTHVTWDVMSEVEPSENVPVAVNCWVEFIVKSTGDAGSTSIEDNGITVI
jgi:hypothetical protein